MDWLLNEIYIIGGVSLGLFLSICMYGYKIMCLRGKGGKKQSNFDEPEDFKIEEWKSEIEDEDSCRISIASSIFSGKVNENDRNMKQKEPLPITFLANLLNDLSDKLEQIKEFEGKIKSQERKMKKLSSLNKSLEKRVCKLEGELTKRDPFSDYASMKGLEVTYSGPSFCACNPGDKGACI